MYTEKQIQLVMWMPKPTDSDEYCHLVLDTLRNLMDVCKENVVVEQETWSIAPLMNPTGMTRAYMYDATNLDRWQQDKKLMCNDCTNIDVKADYVTEKKAKRAIRAYARIHDLRPKEFQGQNLEIVVEIPRSCWQKISADDFKAAVQTASCTLSATYTAIDQDWLCPAGDAPFVYFARKEEGVNLDHCIPAICWAEFLPLSRIADSEAVLSAQIPNWQWQTVQGNNQQYVWIQCSEDIWKPKIASRMLFRKHFFASFPPLDFAMLAEHKNMMMYRELIPWMPLLETEQEQVELNK